MSKNHQAQHERLYTAHEIANLLNVTAKWVYGACRHYDMPHYRIGAYVRFAPSEVLNWVRETGATRQSVSY